MVIEYSGKCKYFFLQALGVLEFSFLKSDFDSNITLLKLGSPSSELHNYYVECLRQFLKLGFNKLCMYLGCQIVNNFWKVSK